MRVARAVALAAGLLGLVACGDPSPAAEPDSGVNGMVHLGPQCPVEDSQHPCPEVPAAGLTVIVSERVPGEALAAGPEVARTTTEADGSFTVALVPGVYVVTAEAGLSCELVDAPVARGAHTEVDVPCDTGIR